MDKRCECVCCYGYTSSYDRRFERYDQDAGPHRCITDHPGVLELLAPAPLEVMWENFKSTHGKYFHVFSLECFSWYWDQLTSVFRPIRL